MLPGGHGPFKDYIWKGSKMTETVTLPSGIKYVDHVVGTGETPKKGQQVTVHYTGWLDENGEKGKKFDSSRDRGQPFVFKLGVGQVISGWDIGVSTMQPGGQRTLVLPAEHGYGQRGAGGLIPPGATLIFDVELISFA
jgi:peptidylprolyl isomerase